MMDYDSLCSYSAHVSNKLLNLAELRDFETNAEQIYYILDQCQAISEAYDPSPVYDASASARLLTVLGQSFHKLADGWSGEMIMKEHKGLWADTNKNWLMGEFAQAVRNVLDSHQLKDAIALELGAGVGATSDIISHKFDKYWRSDLIKFRNKDLVINFDYPIAYFNLQFDYVIATNALHCSADKEKALSNIATIVKKGGRIVVAEGDPSPKGKVFPLNNAYGLFGGWWDRGGFLTMTEWFEIFDKVGLKLSSLTPVRSDDIVSVGYVYVLEKV